MSVNILIITHGDIGKALLATVKHTFNTLPLPITVASITPTTDPAALVIKLNKQLSNLNEGDGVLILTDLYGSTPGNIAKQLALSGQTRVIAGINLPMLLRIMNYPCLSLQELTQKALSGGQDGIINCDENSEFEKMI
jgi:mannose PTS system EIIA component